LQPQEQSGGQEQHWPQTPSSQEHLSSSVIAAPHLLQVSSAMISFDYFKFGFAFDCVAFFKRKKSSTRNLELL